MIEKIKALVVAHAGLAGDGSDLAEDTDLYRAGMKSFASVQLMLALEEAFEIEFPEEMLNRATFRSIGAIEQAIASLAPDSLAA
jgi:acyl carrier protein